MKFRQEITHERLKEKLNYDPVTGFFTWRVDHKNAKIGSQAGWIDGAGYRNIMVDGISYLAHRLAWFYHYGEWPKDQLDHDNRVRTDNRICNLNASSKVHNARNCRVRVTSTSGVTGVNWSTRKESWQVRIGVHGKRVSGGYFTNKKAAIKKRKELEKRYNFR